MSERHQREDTHSLSLERGKDIFYATIRHWYSNYSSEMDLTVDTLMLIVDLCDLCDRFSLSLTCRSLSFLRLRVDTKYLCDSASTHGYHSLFTHFVSLGFLWTDRTYLNLVLVGDTQTLQWMIDSGVHARVDEHRACATAAKKGDMTSLLLLSEIGLVLDEGVLSGACEGGDETIVKWLLDNGLLFDEYSVEAAGEGGHRHLLKYMVDADYQLAFCRGAAKGGHLELLQEVWDREECTCSSVFCAAVSSTRFDSVQWLLDVGCPWDAEVFIAGVESGSVAMLQWLEDNGCPRDPDSLSYTACYMGFIHVLDWLVERGYPISSECHGAAVYYNNDFMSDVVEWLCSRGQHPVSKDVVNAVNMSNTNALEFYRKRGYFTKTEDVLQTLHFAEPSVLTWAKPHDLIDIDRVFETACSGGDSLAVRWCLDNGYEVTDISVSYLLLSDKLKMMLGEVLGRLPKQ